MNQLFEQLGPLAYPLLLCSVVAATLIIERTIYFLGLPRLKKEAFNVLTRTILQKDWESVQESLGQIPQPFRDALGRFLAARNEPAELREEMARLWLISQHKRLVRGIPLLTLLAIVSPLFGLLGTVLGMIEAFQAVSVHTGPVHPALLADGLWEAMLTTATGLFIAIPALTVAHLLRMWARVYLERCEFEFNRISLAVQGIDAFGLSAPVGSYVSGYRQLHGAEA
ncbi:MAG: MotA/TolQ/ExbB proton channel family protein [Gammaproteobacteria bacterium]